MMSRTAESSSQKIFMPRRSGEPRFGPQQYYNRPRKPAWCRAGRCIRYPDLPGTRAFRLPPKFCGAANGAMSRGAKKSHAEERSLIYINENRSKKLSEKQPGNDR